MNLLFVYYEFILFLMKKLAFILLSFLLFVACSTNSGDSYITTVNEKENEVLLTDLAGLEFALSCRVVAESKSCGIVFSGFTLEELLGFSKPVFSEMLLSCTDLLIDGRYIKELDDSKTLRGSSNQRVLPLTERYLEYLGIYGVKGRKVEWKNLHGRRFMCGVPTQEQLAQFKKTV